MIEMRDVSKQLKRKPILRNISETFESGTIYGIFGRNGSGKTMLLRALAGLMVPTEGEIFINGKQLHKDVSFPPNAGVIIEHMELLPQYDAFTNLRILSKINKTASTEDIIQAIERVGLDPYSKLKVKKFSLGMKQRLNIAQAIFEKPDLLLLDEPTNAIDENGISLVHQVFMEEKERGATLLIASHHQEDIAPLCDVRLRMAEGQLFHE
ncbi:MAG TPA: ATP-binding cassette domain-containing protein [Bacillales bacterium]|nr:ATP-binding cassette domain-containing protein [Bacillales bacterium]